MKRLRITVGKKSYEVLVEDLTAESPNRPTTSSTPTTRPASPEPARQETAAPVPAKPQLPISTGSVTSPMAGSVKSVLVEVGDEVNERQPLIILEAMKMENQITAPIAGTVQSVEVSEGESVAEGHVLLVLE